MRIGDEEGDGLSEVFAPAPGRRPLAVCGRDGLEVDLCLEGGELARSVDGGKSWRTVGLPLGERTAVPLGITTAMMPGSASFVCDVANSQVLEVDADDTLRSVLDARHGLLMPSALAMDGDDIIVADAAENRVRRFVSSSTGFAPAEHIDGRRPDGTLRFDQVGGIAIGSF